MSSFPIADAPPARDYHARMTRRGRARAALHQRRQRLRTRYAALFAVIAVPAMAGATDWGSATTNEAPQQAVRPYAAPASLGLTPAAYTITDIHSDSNPAPSFGDAMTSAGPAARAFVATGTPFDRARAEQCLTMAIYYEAATQPDDGQRAVAQVVLNRVAHPSFPNTVCGVVFEGSERGTGCQFTFACDGSLARQPAALWWDRARRVARDALAGAVFAPVGLATHYHTLAVHPAWDGAMERVATIGAHEFFRWRGPAGDKAAFRLAYFGGEPAAAPHPRVFTPAPAMSDDPVALARAYELAHPAGLVPLQAHELSIAKASAATPTPAYSQAVQARGGDALFRGGNLPAGGALSPQLQQSGQWIDHP